MDLEFAEELQNTGGSQWPTAGLLRTTTSGIPAGFIDFLLSRREARVLIRMIGVRPPFRRRGIATEMMDELRRRHPRIQQLVLPELLDDGRPFFRHYKRKMATD